MTRLSRVFFFAPLIIVSFYFTLATANIESAELQTIKTRVAPFANGYIAAAWDYCPEAVSAETLEFDSKKSSTDLLVFRFRYGNPFTYCNDGVPSDCEISVSKLADGTWDQTWPEVTCN